MSDLRSLLADLPYRIVTRAQPISDDERCPHIATQGLPLQDACDVGAHIVQDIRPSFRRMGYLASSPSCGFNMHMHMHMHMCMHMCMHMHICMHMHQEFRALMHMPQAPCTTLFIRCSSRLPCLHSYCAAALSG